MSRSGWWARRAATATGLVMLSGLLTPVVYAADVDPLGAPKLPAPYSQKVRPFTAKPDKKVTAAVARAAAADDRAAARAREDQQRKVTWPTGGRATATLPARGSATVSPGSLPVTLTQPPDGRGAKDKTASAVTVEVLDQKATGGLGVRGVALQVSAATGGRAQLVVNYKAFASAYGGDWAGRLQLSSLPDCALSDPAAAKCRTRDILDYTNDRLGQRLSASVTLPADGSPMVLAVAAGTKSGAGDYKATPLSASSTWDAGGSSGNFTWSYPLRVPPSAAGPKPDLSISYDSGSVDGQTATTNNQGTAIGAGFDLTASYIERKYGSCDDDGQTDKFDLCWKYDNASLVLNGKATELVKDDVSGKWRLKNDDASTVTHLPGADNGDDNGEHWTIVTGDGTKYVFGLNKPDGAGADDRTNSVWTVPVFGDDPDEPGYADGTSFPGRAKKQAWRWNLDYVEDTHANAMTYWYAAESNNYDQLGDDTTGTGYIRGGYLKEIRYGQRATTLFSGSPAASNKVVLSYAERCLASGTGCDELKDGTRDNWPDVPFDAVCKDGDKCTGNVGPSFFTRKRLTGITTYAWNAAAATPAFEAVDTWALKQKYLDPGETSDSTDQSLWLDEIKHTGKRGSELSLDPVKFNHEFRANRVDGASDDILPLNRPRLKTVTSETGAQTIVGYADADCTAGQTKPAVDQNTKRCYPVYWSPNGEKEPLLDWFQKYPVTSVSTSDPQGGGEAVQHSYQYSAEGGAWHYNEDPLTPEKQRTWSVWRGFGKVTHFTGAPNGPRSKTVTVYLRGMNGDRVLGTDGRTPDREQRRTVEVTGIKAGKITDSDQYAGFTRESVTYNGDAEVSGSVNDPWSKRTATQHKSYADTEAYYVRTAATHNRTNVTSKLTPYDQIRTVRTTFDDYGMAETVEDQGDDSVSGDETCTRTWYARNDTMGINSLTSRVRKVGKTCATSDAALDLPADSSRPGDVIADTATVYDDTAATTWPSSRKPTKGDAVWTGRARGYGGDDDPAWQKVSTATYDSLGRGLTIKDTNGLTTARTTYAPTATGPLTSTTVEDAKTYVTTTLVDFGTGFPTKITDPNGKVTESTYDSLGRTTQVWLPNRLRILNAEPNYVYGYHVTSKESDISWVSTASLRGDGSGYNTTYEFYDSLLRSRQVQTRSPAGGRLISLTLYDSRGLAVGTRGDIWDSGSLPTGEFMETEGNQAPIETNTTYDGAGRVGRAVTSGRDISATGAVLIRRLTVDTTYTGDTVATSAPTGGQAVAVVTNALGQTTQRREYAGAQPTGTAYAATDFTYTPTGQQKTITGPDNARWTYAYDLFGRQVKTSDPDKGTSISTYDELDQVTSTENAEKKKLLYEYDLLGRKTGMWQTDKTDANKLTAWTYDSLAKGQQDTAVRYDGGAGGRAYTQKITKYDNLYQVTGSELLLPAADPLVTAGVSKTLSFSGQYNVSGAPTTSTEPGVGGLATETVEYKYNATGQTLSSQGTSSYLQDAAYSPQGDLTQLRLGMSSAASAKKAYLNYTYEPGFRRLTDSFVTDDVHAYRPQSLKFTQDDAGNVTSVFDGTTQGGAGKADHQCFSYDGHSRLTEAWTPKTEDCAASGRTAGNIDGQAPYWTSYTYNEAGQRKAGTEHGVGVDQGQDVERKYSYPAAGAAQPHTLSGVSTTGDGSRDETFTYDKAGNTTERTTTTSHQYFRAGWKLTSGQDVRTQRARLVMRADGDLVLYDRKTGEVSWHTDTGGHTGAWATMQEDGNFVVYDKDSKPLWDTKTWGSGYFATLQDTGVFAVHDKDWVSKWSAGTWLGSEPVTSGSQGHTWDSEGKLATTTNPKGAQTSYLYDANGELLIRRATGDGDTVLYVGGTEVRLTTKGTAKTLSGTRYYSAAGQTIAVRTATSGVSGTKLNFLAADHHGTSSIAMDATTYAVTKRYTTPFGAPRGETPTTWPDDKGFLGKPADDATGLTHIGAREYDPAIGQFLSVDPLLNISEPQSLNGYGYAGNSPVTQADPTGLDPCGGLKCGHEGDDCSDAEIYCYGAKPDGTADTTGVVPGGSGTSHTTSHGQTMRNENGEVLACAYGHCVGNVGPSDVDKNVGNFFFGVGRPFAIALDVASILFSPSCAMEGVCLTKQYDEWGAEHGWNPDSQGALLGASLPFAGRGKGGNERPAPKIDAKRLPTPTQISVAEKFGGIQVAQGYKFPNRRTARQAASEMVGNLGSEAQAIRARDFNGGPNWMKTSDRVIGRESKDHGAGWRDDFLGHDFGKGDVVPPHVNVWGPGLNGKVHLFYGS
ncbi:RHS repeat-associated core domain-containing protein [Streptomyces sp. LRE541]|uniref:RHS repeat-associated core domain-containing protein n=1 Tax=Streptomyces sp. LRE541 TaxID=2931983 RepID=UPI002010B4EA|nr:RHS repeat-associated core domain-containing protein [Streptomyces sp. LRE541]UPZ28860.1 RHS repeat-associated core domain-containing protein [Streptomyces sp. LRE541]